MLGGDRPDRRTFALPPGGVDSPEVLGHVRAITLRLHAQNCRSSWMIVAAGEVVGLIGFKTPPRDGTVEIGYGVAHSRRTRGFGTAAVSAVLKAADDEPGLIAVVAETTLANFASMRVLEKNGFQRTGTRFDSEDGEVIVWRRATARGRRAAASPSSP